jgi:hypothetical protein
MFNISHVTNLLRLLLPPNYFPAVSLYIKFCKEIEIVSEWEHLWGCTTTHLKANVAVMSVKIKVLRSDFTKVAKLCYFGLPSLSFRQHHTHPFLSTCGPPNYKWGQFIETSWKFIKNTRPTSSNITVIYLTNLLICYLYQLLTYCKTRKYLIW